MNSPQYAADLDRTFSTYAEFYLESAYSTFPQDHRAGGSFGVSIVKVNQGPIDFIDSPVPEIVFCRGDDAMKDVLIDCGDGVKTSEKSPSGFTIYPANTAIRTRVNHRHRITSIALPVSSVTEEMQSAGITSDGSNFGHWIGRVRAAPISTSRLMDRMWQVLQDPLQANHLLLDGLTLQLLAELSGAGNLAPLGGARPEDERIARVIDYIEAHYGDALTIAELAAIACLSPGHFSRTFKATTGDPVWTYVQKRRCVRAKEMLITTNLPIAEISYRCGFANQGHLTRCFKAAFDVTPAVARHELRCP